MVALIARMLAVRLPSAPGALVLRPQPTIQPDAQPTPELVLAGQAD